MEIIKHVLTVFFGALIGRWWKATKSPTPSIECFGLVGLCRDQNGTPVVCLGLIEDGMAIVYDQDDPEAINYSVFANNLARVDD